MYASRVLLREPGLSDDACVSSVSTAAVLSRGLEQVCSAVTE